MSDPILDEYRQLASELTATEDEATEDRLLDKLDDLWKRMTPEQRIEARKQ